MELSKRLGGGVTLRVWRDLFSLRSPDNRCYPYQPAWWGAEAAAVGRAAACGDMPSCILADWIEDHPGFHSPGEVAMMANFLREGDA